MRKSAKTILVAAALATAGVLANPAQALAAGYSPEGVCGAGFGRVLGGTIPVKLSSGRVFGYVYLLYNRTTGYNCVTTIKTSFVGTKTYVSVRLESLLERHRDQPKYTEVKSDAGKYKYYAGPVKVYAKQRCVKFWGVIKANGHDRTAGGGRRTWGNCGG